jgi:hypothetical protein
MFFGIPKTQETINQFEENIQEYDPNKAPPDTLPNTLPAGVIKVPIDKINELPEELRRQIVNVDFSETKLQPNLKEAIEYIQKESSAKPPVNAPLGQKPTVSFDAVKKVSYSELPEEQRVAVNEALTNFNEVMRTFSEQNNIKINNNDALTFGSVNEVQQHINEVWAQQAAEPTTTVVTAPPVEAPSLPQYERPVIRTTSTICPYCNHDIRQEIPEVTKEQKQNFLLSIVSGSPYRETLSLFDGKVLIKLRSLTVDESDLINIVVERIQQDQTVPSAIKTSVDTRAFLTMYIETITIGDRVITLPGIRFDANDLDASCQALYAKFDQIKKVCNSVDLLRTIAHECSLFYARYARMLTLATDPNFWKPMSL